MTNSKKITQEQIDSVLDVVFKINAPVQVYSGLQKLFNELPVVEEKKEKKD